MSISCTQYLCLPSNNIPIAAPNARSFKLVWLFKIIWLSETNKLKILIGLYFWVRRYNKTLLKCLAPQETPSVPGKLTVSRVGLSCLKWFVLICFYWIFIQPGKKKDYESNELIIKLILDFSRDLMITLCEILITTSIYIQGSDTKIPQARSFFYMYMEYSEISREKLLLCAPYYWKIQPYLKHTLQNRAS